MKPIVRTTRVLVLLLCLAVIAACNDENDPVPRDDAEAFDLDLALELARLNLYAYDQLEAFLDDEDFALPAPYRLEAELTTREHFAGELFGGNERVTLGFIATSGDAIYVVFRGTETISEWLSNVTYPQERFNFVEESGRTHQGFTNVYQSIRQDMLATVRALNNSGTYNSLYVVGHSLGGAIAVMAAFELQNSFPLEPVMYNFGAPRVGDQDFRDSYMASVRTSWRIVNTNDVVPDVPPTSIISFDEFPPRELFYRHVFSERTVTFGRNINDPLDVLRIRSNHNLCNYHNILCDETNDPEGCRELAGGVDDCNG